MRINTNSDIPLKLNLRVDLKVSSSARPSVAANQSINSQLDVKSAK